MLSLKEIREYEADIELYCIEFLTFNRGDVTPNYSSKRH
jgi:hypothetical protein